jgi:acetoin:2,6-dichlorophenolindophenol oxidoreductase subunit alpha
MTKKLANRAALYERMALIRCFEERLLELFGAGKLHGTTHTCIGQEANAIAVMENLQQGDLIFTNHRCHGHYLARFGDDKGLLAELMGREGGICGGRGGSQHLCRDGFFSSGVQGGFVPIAAGMALAEKRTGSGAVVVAFIGDGTLGQGSVYETLNMVSLWQVPLLIVVENNRYAQTTPLEMNLAGSIPDRIAAFDVSVGECESNDVEELLPRFGQAIDNARKKQRPHVEIIHTYRLNAHSKGDDFRPAAEIEDWRSRDPMLILGNRLPEDERETIETSVRQRLALVEAEVEEMPPARLTDDQTAMASRPSSAAQGFS